MGKIINHVTYADDFVLLSSFRSTREKQLKICEFYAETQGLCLNQQKAQLQMFLQKYK